MRDLKVIWQAHIQVSSKELAVLPPGHYLAVRRLPPS
jgi:hypothetical protein